MLMWLLWMLKWLFVVVVEGVEVMIVADLVVIVFVDVEWFLWIKHPQ